MFKGTNITMRLGLRLLGGEFVIVETSALARETLKLFYSTKRLFGFLASENEVNDESDVCGYANEGGAVACSPSA